MHWGSNTGSLNFTKRFELKEDYSYSAGSHQWKFGAEYARYISPEDVIANLGTWTFATDQFFDGSAAAIAALRNPTTFTASFPNVVRKLQNYWINGYGQDEWKPLSNLTLNLGVRYDLQYHSFNNQLDFTGRESLKQLVDPTTRHDNNNIGPRVGMAWDVRNDTKTLVRAAYGRFYQYLPQGGLRNELGHAAAEQHQHHEPDVSGSVRRPVASVVRHGDRRGRTSTSSTTRSTTCRATR